MYLSHANTAVYGRGTKEQQSGAITFPQSRVCLPTAAATVQSVSRRKRLFGEAERKDELTQEVIWLPHIWPFSFQGEVA